GQLYSDSLGDASSGADTYILTVKANIDTIVDALK
ncbi:MAG: manganese transporter, partial [Lacrimispora sp.]